MPYAQRSGVGMVYVMTNALNNNEVIAFMRSTNGTLTRLKSYRTGGNGTGQQKVDPLGSQGSLIVSPDGLFLFSVNAGSNSISSFRISSGGELTLANVVPSNGITPNSLAVFNDLLYVCNAGNATNHSNITGFQIRRNGYLRPIPGASHSLSTPNASPACIVFSPSGNQLIVSEVSINRLSVFMIKKSGVLSPPVVNNASGMGPFGSVFLSKGFLLVAEANSNALSSYTIADNGMLTAVSGSVLNNQSATCWVTSGQDERFAYTSNTGSGTITTYKVNPDGNMTVISNIYSTPTGTAAPTDNGVSRDGQNFYVLNDNEGTISVFQTEDNGRLTLLQLFEDTGLPKIGAQGLAVL